MRRRRHRHRNHGQAKEETVKEDLRGAALRLTVFTMVCAVATFALWSVFGQWRFGAKQTYLAEFVTVSGLREGDFVRIAGVEVGKVAHIAISPQATAIVQFSADDSVVLTHGSKAIIRYDNLIGGRYMELLEGAGPPDRLQPGQTIPVDRTEPALDLDALLGGFRPLFRALSPDQVNTLSDQLIRAFQGQGVTISSFLAQSASLTDTLANRDSLIGQVLTNLNILLGAVGDQSARFAQAVDSLSSLVSGLAARKDELSNGLAGISTGSGSLAKLLAEIRPALPNVVTQADRTAATVLADRDYFDWTLKTLPDAYQALARQGIYGDYFSFYLCDLVLKLNGKGGQPVYVKIAGQSSGRCTPK
jgi:phospholipid/cholesterol/gamma-HCH transport system substrate-binding protein